MTTRHVCLLPLLGLISLFACTTASQEDPPSLQGNDISSSKNETSPSNEETNGGLVDDRVPADGPLPVGVPAFKSLAERCKLISARNLDTPTANNTHFRANLRGTDLGIPIAHNSDLFFFFGDTAGVRAIWPLGPESLPDAVSFANYPAVKTDPNTLCANMRFLAGPPGGLGHAQDNRIERDFIVGAMNPPPGKPISEFIHNPSGPRGANRFPNLPGDFEVPSGGFSYNGSIYLFYTTVVSPNVVQMKGAYLAKWKAPSNTGTPTYDILYHVDQRFDGNGQLRGDFINIAPIIVGDWLYLYGSGEYRRSNVHLARKKLASIDTPGGFERFDAATNTWKAANDASAKPVALSPAVGELSVQYFPNLRRYVMMNQEINGNGNQIVARFATAPEGPWSGPIVMGTMEDPAFKTKYCCVNNVCDGERLFNCDRAGFYGTYMLPDAQLNSDGSFSLSFTMSTWDPYNVALMTATFQ